MTSVARTGLIVAMISGWMVLGLAFSQKSEPTRPASAEKTNRQFAQTIGMAGCAATGCHGRTDVRHGKFDSETWRESLALWIDRDPHFRAYSVLEGPLATDIMRNLRDGDKSLPQKATEDARCLACHTNPSLATSAAMKEPGLKLLRAEGVSCESCHGNAEFWQIAHTEAIAPESREAKLKSWQMNDLNDWRVQAATCAGCHVGAAEDTERGLPLRDMNHDMIAAGHPRLEFDFPLFQSKMAKHWQPKHRGAGPNPGTDSMLHAWVHGQIATEEAGCQLSLDRIARANTERSPYPEFADWNCSQCHHQLQPAEWRTAATEVQTKGLIRSLGRPMWIGTSAFLPSMPVAKFGSPLMDQKKALGSRLGKLNESLDALKKNPNGNIRPAVLEFLATGPTHKLNWEEASRVYLGLRSLDACLQSAGSATSHDASDLRKALWGAPSEPTRKEYAGKGYQRKPESRWSWEQMSPSMRPDTFEATVRKYREMLAADLQKLPLPNSKP